MRSRRLRSDYHLLVAQNFLSNISRTGEHDDTNLRIFNRHGLLKLGHVPSLSEEADSAPQQPILENDPNTILVDECSSLPALSAPMSLKSHKVSANSQAESDSYITSPYHTQTTAFGGSRNGLHRSDKKSSILQRLFAIISTDSDLSLALRPDESSLADEGAESIPMTSSKFPRRERKITSTTSRESICSDSSERPGSPLSVMNFPFFKRIRTTISKGERCYLCPESSGPVAVIAHLPYLSHDRKRLRRSRSTLAASTERVRNISQCSSDELRPFDFQRDRDSEEAEFSFGHLLGRRRGYSPCVAAFSSPTGGPTNGVLPASVIATRRSERRESQYLDTSRLLSPDAAIDISDIKDISFDEHDEMEWDDSPVEHYDPSTFEDIEAVKKTVIRTNGFVGVTLHFGAADTVKTAMNEKFSEKFPRIDLTFSKFKSIKREMAALGKECRIDMFTVAQALVYYERIVLKNLISKSNRKVVAGTSFLLAVKLNDYNRRDLVKTLLEVCSDRLRVSRRDLLSMELPLCAALKFDLISPVDHIMPHYNRLVLENM